MTPRVNAEELDAALSLTSHRRYGEVVRHCLSATRAGEAKAATARVLGTLAPPDEALEAIASTITPELAVVRAVASLELVLRNGQDIATLDGKCAGAMLALEALPSAPRAASTTMIEGLARAALRTGASPGRVMRAARALRNRNAVNAAVRALANAD